MSNNWIAFFVGLFGSVHCIGMCGPLAFAVPSIQERWWPLVADKMMYNFGRIITYSALGLLAGFIGKQLWLLGLQQGISLLSGLFVLLAGCSRIFKIRMAKNGFSSFFVLPVNSLLKFALNHKAGHFFVGILNGLLPCGFVYLALVGAINNSSPAAAAFYMFWFGAGTFPLMLLATVSTGFAGPVIRRRINKTIPYFMVFLGIWFILRGTNLNIPYLSPAKTPSGNICR